MSDVPGSYCTVYKVDSLFPCWDYTDIDGDFVYCEGLDLNAQSLQIHINQYQQIGMDSLYISNGSNQNLSKYQPVNEITNTSKSEVKQNDWPIPYRKLADYARWCWGPGRQMEIQT